MTGEPAFFELGVEDAEKAQRFYGALLNWSFTAVPGGGAQIATGGLPGGMHSGDKGATPYVFFAVDDIDDAIRQVEELGGTVQDIEIDGDAEQQKQTGRFKLCVDDQGSPFGLHQRPRP